MKDKSREWSGYLLTSYCKGATFAFQTGEGSSVMLQSVSTSTPHRHTEVIAKRNSPALSYCNRETGNVRFMLLAAYSLCPIQHTNCLIFRCHSGVLFTFSNKW